MHEAKLRILIVEDEEKMIKALTLRLTANNYEVLVARDGDAGYKKAHDEKPDLIILDVMLPKMDGFSVCRMLKFDEVYEKIPIIILTARIQKTDFAKGEQVGADAYITKPFKSEELLQKIQELLAKKKK